MSIVDELEASREDIIEFLSIVDGGMDLPVLFLFPVRGLHEEWFRDLPFEI